MSQVRVGSVLKFKGFDCICSKIRTVKETCFAKDNSVTFEATLKEPVNCTFLDLKVQPFEEKQIICIEFDLAELTSPGRNVFFVYTKYWAYKEGEKIDVGTTTERDATGASGSEAVRNETEGTGERNSSGQGVGEKTPSPTDNPVYSDGRDREEGDTGGSREDQRTEYAKA